jgi:hypothetical protein
LIVLLDLFLQLVDPLLRDIWHQLARGPTARPNISALLIQVNSLEAALFAPWLKLLLKVLELRLEIGVVDLLLVADVRLRVVRAFIQLLLVFLRRLVLDLIKYFNIGRNLLLPILNL